MTADQYSMRGHRVRSMKEEKIKLLAEIICTGLRIDSCTRRAMPKFIENLYDPFDIIIEVIPDKEWYYPTDAISRPELREIHLPEKNYKAACKGDPYAVFTFFHELGHVFLGHEKIFHNEKSCPPSIEEDAEWQADTFAEYIVSKMAIRKQKYCEQPRLF